MSKVYCSLLVFLCISCGATGAQGTLEPRQSETRIAPMLSQDSGLQTDSSPPEISTRTEKEVLRRANSALHALKSDNTKALSVLVHPNKGLRFSPYNEVLIGKNQDLVFTKAQVATLMANNKKYTWGAFDGSGDPIRLTFRGYYRRFIYDYDFSKLTPTFLQSSGITGSRVSIYNIGEVYPGAIIAQYHFEGLKDKYEGMNWKTLWLVFQRNHNSWYLVGIVHGEWTI